jgi:hypothetical protein
MKLRYATLSRSEVEHRLRIDAFSTFIESPDEAYIDDIEAERWFNAEVDYLNRRFGDLAMDIEAVDKAHDEGQLSDDGYYRWERRLEELSEKAMEDTQVFSDAAESWDRSYGTSYAKLVNKVVTPAADIERTAERKESEAQLDAEFDSEQDALENELSEELEAEIAAEAQAELEREMQAEEERQRALEERVQRERETLESLPPRAQRRARDLGFGE